MAQLFHLAIAVSVRLLFAAAGAAADEAGGGGSSAPLHKRLLPPPIVSSLGARCMDGSAGGYYDAPGAGENATKLVVFIEGGGECRTLADCQAWHASHASNSSSWPPTRDGRTATEMDPDCGANPDFCSWRRVFIPYCTGDMHSGTRTDREESLGGYYFSGHLQIAGVVADLKAGGRAEPGPPPGSLSPQCMAELEKDCPGLRDQGESCGHCVGEHAGDLRSVGCPAQYQPVYDAFCNPSLHGTAASAWSPTHVLVTGSSAGGIGALMHTDFFAEQWPAPAIVKGAPQCGFFYAGVTATTDLAAGQPTPVAHLGFIPEWKPWLPTACAKATGNNMSLCTDAHTLYPHLQAPLFIRENQYDTAKLANCGWDGRDAAYLKLWGQWMRKQLGVISQSPKDGFFSAACLEHGGNFGWRSSPVVKGVHMQDAMHNWFFDTGVKSTQYTMDDCPETTGAGLPCTAVDGVFQRCPHWMGPSPAAPNATLSPRCVAELTKDCPGLRGDGEACAVRARA